MLTTQMAKQTKPLASEKDILLALLRKVEELVEIQKTRDDETFSSQVFSLATGAIAVAENTVTPKYWAIAVSNLSTTGAIVRAYRERIVNVPAQGNEVVAMGIGEGYRIPGRQAFLCFANTGTAAAVVVVSAVGDANFGKL